MATTTVMTQPAPAPAPVVVTTTTTTRGNSMRNAIPSFPAPVAILLAIINFFLPGIGTILAGFFVLCFGNVGQSGGSRFGTFCINFWVGILQILLVPIFLVGWIWSIIWGYAFIASTATDTKKTTTTTSVLSPTAGAASTTVTTVK